VKLLVLGGTKFLGRHLVESALARGHKVTLFNRGQTNPDLFPEAEHLRGDRDGDLSALEDRSWDAVVDTCGFVPRVVRASAELLAGAVDHYTFVSTIGVYAEFPHPGIDETAPVGALTEETEDAEGPAYGPLKALCEQEVERALPERTLVVRPGLIVGPDDPTDRFTYWPRRVERGGEVLAPAPPEQPVQLVDVRDLAAWTLRMVEEGTVGTFNATSPPGALTFADVLAACGAADVVWVDGEFLLEQGVEEWSDLPLWISSRDPAWSGFQLVDVSRALAAGLTFRPLDETARDAPEWTGKAGLSPEREAELLTAWRARG